MTDEQRAALAALRRAGEAATAATAADERRLAGFRVVSAVRRCRRAGLADDRISRTLKAVAPDHAARHPQEQS